MLIGTLCDQQRKCHGITETQKRIEKGSQRCVTVVSFFFIREGQVVLVVGLLRELWEGCYVQYV